MGQMSTSAVTVVFNKSITKKHVLMSVVDKAAMKKGGPMMAYTVRLRPGFRYMKGLGNLPFWVCEKAQKG